MPTAAPQRPTPAVRNEATVDQAIAAAAGKVRANDLLTGAAAVLVLVVGYVTTVMILDRWLVLPMWVRQLGFGGFLASLAAVGYFAVVRPLRRRVNPRYIARQVEQTIPDAKNVLINWVDLHDRELPGSVRAAVAAKAADELADADVDTATGSRRLVWLGTALGVLVLVLGGLFLLVKGSQFSSLVSRAVNPFANTAIASRTRIDLLEPAGGNATVTDGEQLNVAISIGGRLPDAAGPEKPRLLVRHNPDATEYDEFPLVRGEGSRDFSLMVPRSVIQNGFWYRVAAGDGLTPEYRVGVRTRPMVNGFRAEYEYPAYLKWPADVGTDARVRGPRGAAVALTVTTNREMTGGSIIVTTPGRSEAIPGVVTGEKRNALRFPLKLVESGTYRVQFQPAGAEGVALSGEYPLDVEIDQAPRVTIDSPKEEEIVLPAGERLAVDATIQDDHGIVSAALRFRLNGQDTPAIPAKKYRDGKPFVRAMDGTHETEVPDYKDSVKLDALTDDKGKPLALKENDVLEFWVEATDNCTEPTANVGASAKKKVRIAPPPPKPDPMQQQRKDDKRRQEEAKAQQKQDQRQQNDTRPQDQARNPDPDKQPNQPQDPNKQGEPQQGDQPGKADDKNPMGNGQPGNDPNAKPDPSGQPGNDPNVKPDPNSKPDPNQKPDPKTQSDGSPDQKSGTGDKPDDKTQQKQAQDIQDKINEKKGEPGDARGDGTNAPQGQETKPVGENKPGDKGNPQGNDKGAAQPKDGEPGDKPGTPPPAENKNGGTLTQPERSADKEGPKEGAQGDQQPAGEQPKSPPKDGAEAGTSKGSNPNQGGQPNDPGELDRENGGSKPQDKLDKLAGKEHRDTVERLNRDLNSGDPKRQEQAKKEIDELTKKHQDELAKKNQGNDKQDAAGGAKGAEPQPKNGDKPDQQPGSKEGGSDQVDKSDAKHPDDLSGAKGSGDPTRGDTKKEEKQPQGRGGADSKEPKSDDQPGAGDAKGEKPMDPAATKDGKTDPKGGNQPGQKQNGPPPDAAKDKGPPPESGTDPMNKDGDPAASKSDGSKDGDPMGTKDDDKGKTKPPMTQQDVKKDGAGTGKPDEKNGDGSKPDGKTPPKAGGTDQKDPKQDQGNPSGGQNDQKIDPKELEQAVRDLDSENPGTREAARQKLDEKIGKQNRETVERLNRDLKSGDPMKQQQAKKDIEELAKKQPQGRGGPEGAKPKQMTEQQKQELENAARNLNSDDPADRQKAEQKVDDLIGKKKREELQQDMKDLTGNDPAKAKAAKDKLEQTARDFQNQQGNGKPTDESRNLGGGNVDSEGKPIEGNPEYRLRSAERQLDDFKKYRGNREFLRDAGYTPEQYEQFLKRQQEYVDRLRDEVDTARLNPTAAPQGPAGIRTDAGNERLNGRTPGADVKGFGSASVAPPGFADAQKRFAAEAAKKGQPK